MAKLEDALEYFAAGFSLVPIQFAEKRPYGRFLPLVDGKASWSPFKETRATEDEIRSWFDGVDNMNLGVVCGRVSGGLFVFDFDTHSDVTYSRWRDRTRPLSDRLPLVRTGKGRHLYCRVEGGAVSAHLAKTAENAILIETRGEGTLCILPGSRHPNGQWYSWLRGSAAEIPTLSGDEFAQLVEAAEALNEFVPPVFEKRQPVERKSRSSSISTKGLEDQMVAYAQGVLRNQAQEVAQTAAGGRHLALNRAAFICGRYVGAGLLTADRVTIELEEAALANGHIHDDGFDAFARTVLRAIEDGRQRPVDLDELREKLN